MTAVATRPSEHGAMKWWGWGDEGVAFTHDDKPGFGPFIREHLGIDVDEASAAPLAFDELDVPEPQLSDDLRAALERAVGEEYVSDDPHDRVVHARGKSLRDLVRQRRGDLGRVPDVVVRPGDETEVVEILSAALDADAVVIPFGGGTSISGSLEAPREETRTVVSVDLGRMDRLLEIDETSRLARVQAGVYGPRLEEQLNAHGWTFGHYPDSFTHSTLGGWIATRSSGMQSDRYGDIADSTRGLRVVTPAGLLAVRPVPSTSTGPSVREMVLGSEGRLGIICEATVHVRRLPKERTILGYLFPTWAASVAAMRDIAASEAAPSVTRVADAERDGVLVRDQEGLVAARQGAVEGAPDLPHAPQGLRPRADVPRLRRLRGLRAVRRRAAQGGRADRLPPRRHLHRLEPRRALRPEEVRHALHPRLPARPRRARRRVGDRRAVGRAPGLHAKVTAAARDAFTDLGVQGYVMCHLSHSYHAGACLYFTFAITPSGRRDGLEEYGVVKSAVQQAFVDNGGTLSHHHAVGTEHAEWLEQDISAPGVGHDQGPVRRHRPRREPQSGEDRVTAGPAGSISRHG